MNLLIDKLPTSLLIDGYEYLINSDFRAMIQFEVMMFDEDLSDEERITQALELFYDLPDGCPGHSQLPA